jgi:hypothetical protein
MGNDIIKVVCGIWDDAEGPLLDSSQSLMFRCKIHARSLAITYYIGILNVRGAYDITLIFTIFLCCPVHYLHLFYSFS